MITWIRKVCKWILKHTEIVSACECGTGYDYTCEHKLSGECHLQSNLNCIYKEQ